MKAINIILQADEKSPSSSFVEIEDDEGRSVRIGTASPPDNDGTGLWSIRITPEEITNYAVAYRPRPTTV